jgi:hypothetical protein
MAWALKEEGVMNRLLGRFAVVAMTVGFLCLLGGAAAAKNPVRPFHLRGAGMITSVAPACDGGDLIEESGNATHLGRYEAVACSFVIGMESPTVLVVAGNGVVTAANGDTVNFSFIGTIDVGGAVWPSDVMLTFAGGTGRFADASGQARYLSSRAAFAADYTASATGTIAY